MRFVTQRVAEDRRSFREFNSARLFMPDRQAFGHQILKLFARLFRDILRFLMCELGCLMGPQRHLEGLLGQFVSGQVILFIMMHRGNAMCVRGQFVKLGGALMRIGWHDDPF